MKNEFEKYTYQFLKNYYTKDIISYSKYCVIEEEKNKIVIKFTDRALKTVKKESKNKASINLFCVKNESATDILRKYNLNKPVTYIFDGFTFDDCIKVISNCNIVFKNCVFNAGYEIETSKNVSLEHNSYSIQNLKSIVFLNMSCTCNDLSIKNDMDYFANMNITANKINILNSRISSIGLSGIFIKANELSLIQSDLTSDSNIYIDSLEVFSSNGKIKAKEGIIVENKESYRSNNFTFNCVLNAPIVIYNNIYLTDEKKYTVINQDKLLLNELRQNILEIFKNIRDNCVELNNKKLEDFQNKLSEKPICKVLK